MKKIYTKELQEKVEAHYGILWEGLNIAQINHWLLDNKEKWTVTEHQSPVFGAVELWGIAPNHGIDHERKKHESNTYV